MSTGPIGGFIATAVAMLVRSLAVILEFARRTGTHDYRIFSLSLVGRAAPVFTVSFWKLLRSPAATATRRAAPATGEI